MKIKISGLNVGDMVDITAPGGGDPYDVTGTIIEINKEKKTIKCKEFLNEYHVNYVTKIIKKVVREYADLENK